MIEFDKKSGVYYRGGSYDKNIIGEIKRSYGLLEITKKDVVLDVGGCFGAFVVYAAGFDPKKIAVIEPDKENLKVLKKNCAKRKNVEVIEGACVLNPETPTIQLYKTQGINHGNYSTTPFRGRYDVTVKTLNFRTILKAIRPTIIKMDCEGAEYDLLQQELPKHVKQIAMEIHLTKKEWRTNEAPALIKSFSKWECLRDPKITEANWTTLGTWRR